MFLLSASTGSNRAKAKPNRGIFFYFVLPRPTLPRSARLLTAFSRTHHAPCSRGVRLSSDAASSIKKGSLDCFGLVGASAVAAPEDGRTPLKAYNKAEGVRWIDLGHSHT